MALLLRCLRDLRTLSGDPDLLPPPAGGTYGARSLSSLCDELGGNARRTAALDLARHAPLPFEANPSAFALRH